MVEEIKINKRLIVEVLEDLDIEVILPKIDKAKIILEKICEKKNLPLPTNVQTIKKRIVKIIEKRTDYKRHPSELNDENYEAFDAFKLNNKMIRLLLNQVKAQEVALRSV